MDVEGCDLCSRDMHGCVIDGQPVSHCDTYCSEKCRREDELSE